MPRKQTQPKETTTPPAAIAAAEAVFEQPEEGRPAADVLEEVIEDGKAREAAEIAASPDVKRRTVKRELLCELTPEDLSRKAEEFGKLREDLNAHEAHAKMVKDDLKAKESRLQEAQERVAAELAARKELRPIDVDLIQDFATNSYVEIRHDNGTEIPGSRRALTEDERQVFLKERQKELPLGEVKTKEEKAAEESRTPRSLDDVVNSAFADSGATSSGKVADDGEICAEPGCVLYGAHDTHEDDTGGTWRTPTDLEELR